MNGPDRLNRILLGLLSLVVTAAAGYGLARGYGAFGATRAHDPFLLDNVRSFVGRNHDWIWPCAFVVALGLSYLGFRLLRAQFAPPHNEPQLHNDDGEDRVVVARSVLADAVADDLEREPMITRASAALSGTEHAPELDLALTVPDDVDLAELRSRVVVEAMERAANALESESVAPRVVLTLSESAHRRVG
jgi:hypothetical protein